MTFSIKKLHRHKYPIAFEFLSGDIHQIPVINTFCTICCKHRLGIYIKIFGIKKFLNLKLKLSHNAEKFNEEWRKKEYNFLFGNKNIES